VGRLMAYANALRCRQPRLGDRRHLDDRPVDGALVQGWTDDTVVGLQGDAPSQRASVSHGDRAGTGIPVFTERRNSMISRSCARVLLPRYRIAPSGASSHRRSWATSRRTSSDGATPSSLIRATYRR
jgi:hypothetical protein